MAYASHSLREVYDVNALDLQKCARSFGLQVPPRVDLSAFPSCDTRLLLLTDLVPTLYSLAIPHPA